VVFRYVLRLGCKVVLLSSRVERDSVHDSFELYGGSSSTRRDYYSSLRCDASKMRGKAYRLSCVNCASPLLVHTIFRCGLESGHITSYYEDLSEEFGVACWCAAIYVLKSTVV